MQNIEMAQVHTREIHYSLQQLKNEVDANDIIADPDYQRHYVYDDKRASLLIESILIGIPIPVVYLAEEDDGALSVIDGQQRIMSFVRYLKNEFALTGLIKLKNLNGVYYKNLDKVIQRNLRNKSISAVCIENGSQGLKYDIFSRLNLGAVKLRDQEVRNCLYRGTFNDMLKDIAEHNETLKILFHDENNRFNYEERILRFFALRNYMNLKGTYKLMMNSYMQKHANASEKELQKFKKQYNSLIDTIKTVIGDNVFFSLAPTSRSRNKFNGAIYDSIIIPFSYFPKSSIIRHADEIREQINDLKSSNEDYQKWVYVGTNAGIKIRSRINAVMNILRTILEPTASSQQVRLFDPSIKEQLFHPGYICSYCGNQILSIDDCEIDHIIPFSQGGPTSLENAQLLHKHCNKSKGAHSASSEIDAEEFIDDSDENSDDDSSSK